MRIFLSISTQFKACRKALASDLRAVGAVVVRDGFTQHGELLAKLDRYFAGCDRVIALVGDAYGWEPAEPARPAGRPRRSYAVGTRARREERLSPNTCRPAIFV
jgi:hypothetical protein